MTVIRSVYILVIGFSLYEWEKKTKNDLVYLIFVLKPKTNNLITQHFSFIFIF